MIDPCARPGCPSYRVSRSCDSRPLANRWYCSAECRDIMTRPVHWVPEGWGSHTPCSAGLWLRKTPWLGTADRSLVTCCNCKRSDAWKKVVSEVAESTPQVAVPS